MTKTVKRILSVLTLLVALLSILLLAERGAPGATILSLPSALWYALTTLTTVGYGDLYPVTLLGRLVGAVLQLGSLGLLALLIGALLSLWRTRLGPGLRLRALRDRDWYVFHADDAPSRALAEALEEEDDRRVMIFPASGDTALPGIETELSVAELRRLRGSSEGLHVFFLSDNYSQNEADAAALRRSGCTVCCLTPHRPDRLPEGERRFAPWEICARLYWQRFPLDPGEECIWIIGDGRHARALLEQALLVNVIDPEQQLRYVLCGDYGEFRRCHPALEGMFSPSAAGDRLIAWGRPWNDDPQALESAHRLIFCSDREEENLERLTSLRRYFPVTGRVHARLSLPFDGAETFGSLREICTPELVLHQRLDRTARSLHELYAASNGGPAWEELGDFARRSNRAAADHLPVKLRLLLPGEDIDRPEEALCRRAAAVYARTEGAERQRLRELEHRRWERFHLINNWRWGPVRDDPRRIHPLLRPFEELTPEEQARDDYAWELLGKLR